MAQSQRVLSGSRTRGSTASPSGSIIYSYQGINARTNASYFGSLLPRIGSGNRLKLYKGTKPLSENEFDDSLVINNDTADMRTVSGSIITTRIGFELERMTFGQPPTSQKGESFVDISGFDPVSYLHDPGHSMWPANLWNAGSLSDHEFDGVIEVFDIRREILGQVDLRYDGHAPRGSVTGPFSENPFGSTAITDKWTFSDYALSPFLDGPNEMSRDRGIDTPVLARISQKIDKPWTDPNSAMPFPGYQGLEREGITAFIAEDYHKSVYSKIYHGNSAITAMSQSAYDLNKEWSAGGYDYRASESLIAWWKLNEPVSTLTAQDSGPNSITGSIKNAIPGYTASTPGANYVWNTGGVVDFDGTGDIILIPGKNTPTNETWEDLVGGYFDSVTGTSYLKSFTISAWIRQENSTGIILNIGAHSSDNGGGWKIRANSSGDVAFYRYGGGAGMDAIVTPSNTVPDNTWTHIACVADFSQYDESTSSTYLSVYANGVKTVPALSIDQSTRLRSGSITINKASIGGTTSEGTNLDGQIGDVSVFDRALRSEEIKAIYSATRDFRPEAAVAVQDPIMTALQLLNGSSCDILTDPIEHRANRGFYFGQKAGSIVYGDW